MTELEMVLTGLCIASLVWAAVCHVRMMRAQRGLEESKDRAEAFYNGWVLCTHEVRRLRFQRTALKHGVRVVAKAEAETRELLDDCEYGEHIVQGKLHRQCRALRHGVRVVAQRERVAQDQVGDLVLHAGLLQADLRHRQRHSAARKQDLDRLGVRCSALKRGLRRVGQREQIWLEQIAELDEELYRAFAQEERLSRQCRALGHGILVKGDHEQKALHEARQWAALFVMSEERAKHEFYRGHQACRRMVADDLIALAEKYESKGVWDE